MCSDGTWAAAVAAESGEYNESVAEARITTSSLTLPATVGTLPSAVPPAQRHHEPPSRAATQSASLVVPSRHSATVCVEPRQSPERLSSLQACRARGIEAVRAQPEGSGHVQLISLQAIA